MAKLSNRSTYSGRLTLIYLLTLAGPLSSQVPGASPPKLRVQVLDSATGRPLLWTWTYQWRRDATDASGYEERGTGGGPDIRVVCAGAVHAE
jgi:hypothetical protein